MSQERATPPRSSSPTSGEESDRRQTSPKSRNRQRPMSSRSERARPRVVDDGTCRHELSRTHSARSPNQGVGDSTSFDKMQSAGCIDVHHRDRGIVEAVDHDPVVAETRSDDCIDCDEVAEDHGVGVQSGDVRHDSSSKGLMLVSEIAPRPSHRLAQPLDTPIHGNARWRWDLRHTRFDVNRTVRPEFCKK